MSKPEIKGWCPGARRPMASGDGLVVRVRPPLGRLDPGALRAIADLAEAHGNGEASLTNRANLQIRGVSVAAYPALLAGLADLGLADADSHLEGRLNIVLDPCRGRDCAEVERIGAGLARGLAAPGFAPLPSKFGFVVDTGNARRLSGTSGDVRIETSGDALMVRADGQPAGRRVADADAAVDVALALAAWFIASGGVGGDGRGRMARHLVGTSLPGEFAGDAPPAPAAAPAVPGDTADGVLVAAAFGAFAADGLRALADCGAATIRLTPWRMLHLPGVSAQALRSRRGLILDAQDPLLRMAACIGAPGCPQSSVATRALARELAPHLPPGVRAHVSGCAKGCALPGAAPITLVGRAGVFDLVTDGAPWDVPLARGLSDRKVMEHFGS